MSHFFSLLAPVASPPLILPVGASTHGFCIESRDAPDIEAFLRTLESLANQEQSRRNKSDPAKNFTFDLSVFVERRAEIGWFAQLGSWSRLVLSWTYAVVVNSLPSPSLVLDLRHRCQQSSLAFSCLGLTPSLSTVFPKGDQHTKEETNPLPLGKGWP
jgi:hypothetical protein